MASSRKEIRDRKSKPTRIVQAANDVDVCSGFSLDVDCDGSSPEQYQHETLKQEAEIEIEKKDAQQWESESGTSECEISPNNLNRKKYSVPLQITGNKEDLAVAFIRSHPGLYDHSQSDYYSKDIRKSYFKELGNILGISSEQAQTWLKSQRTMYSKYMKKPECEKNRFTPRQKWLMDRFSFLQGHITVRPRRNHPYTISSVTDPASECHSGGDSSTNASLNTLDPTPKRLCMSAVKAEPVDIWDISSRCTAGASFDHNIATVGEQFLGDCDKQRFTSKGLPEHVQVLCTYLAHQIKDFNDLDFQRFSINVTDLVNQTRRRMLRRDYPEEDPAQF